MTEKAEAIGEQSPEENESSKEQNHVIEEEKEKPEKLTSHQNGVRLRKTKRNSSNKSQNLAKKNQEIKKILAKSSSGKNKTPSTSAVEKFNGFIKNLSGSVLCIAAFIVLFIITICTRFYKLDDPKHIW